MTAPKKEEVIPKQEKKFGFIKKTQSHQSPNSQQNQVKEPSFLKKEMNSPPKKQWTLKDIKELYHHEKDKYNSSLFNYNEDFKNFIRKISVIRNDIATYNHSKESLQKEISMLTKKQNDLIEDNNFDDAMKIEEEIKKRTIELKSVDLSIQQKNENELAKLKWNLIELIKQKNQHLDDYVKNFPNITPNANEAKIHLIAESKQSAASIEKDITLSEKKTEEANNEYQLSLENLKKAEEEFLKKFEEETLGLTNEINELDNQKNSLLKTIEEIEQQLLAKKHELNEVNLRIQDKSNEKEEIRKKYENEDDYVLKKQDKVEKENQYNYSLKILNNYKQISIDNEEKYKQKIEEISKIISSVENNKSLFPKRIITNEKLVETLTQIFTYDEENLKKLHENEKNIDELSSKIIENNEKIEVLDLQNKRINSEIVSVEANIENFEDIKKSFVAKKQFKEAQATNNEIKKYQTNKQSLTELLNGNKDEINSLTQENNAQNESKQKLIQENESLNMIIKENNDKYIKSYFDILKDFYENFDENDADINFVKEEFDIVKNEIGENHEEIKEDKKEITQEKVPKGDSEQSEIQNEVHQEPKEKEEIKKESPKEETHEEKKEEAKEQPLSEEEIKKLKEEKKKELEETIAKLEKELDEVVKVENYEEADVINTKIEKLKEELKQYL